MENLKYQIKILTNKTDDTLVSLILDKAKREIEAITGQEYSSKFDNLAVDMAVIKINRLGTEGIASQGYSGASESFLEDYPPYIKNQLDRFRKKYGLI